ncbi:MAG: UDP-N-acetylmuramate dehydrogenase [Candidatus Omnitrophica bacterium]|nr:UDP-N-acetylmuramate dehydrogenase [Candidatus Omnitrophota bacterium]
MHSNFSTLKTIRGIAIEENVLLSQYTTFQLGGNCPCLITCSTVLQLEAVVKFLREKEISFFVIGEGSNLVVSDFGVDCVVVRFVSKEPDIRLDGCKLAVSAAACLDDVALFAAQQGLRGLNFASGIPGTVGGAISGNAGAFGQQISDCLFYAKLLGLTSKERIVEKDALDFGYRSSNIQKSGDIILSATFVLLPEDPDALLHERKNILKERKEKHPDYKKIPCAGSFFKNIEVGGRRKASGALLDQAGARQMVVGGAGVFEKHANIIIKKNKNCCSQDVFDLSMQMKEIVKKNFDIELNREVRFVGQFKDGKNQDNCLVW